MELDSKFRVKLSCLIIDSNSPGLGIFKPERILGLSELVNTRSYTKPRVEFSFVQRHPPITPRLITEE